MSYMYVVNPIVIVQHVHVQWNLHIMDTLGPAILSFIKSLCEVQNVLSQIWSSSFGTIKPVLYTECPLRVVSLYVLAGHCYYYCLQYKVVSSKWWSIMLRSLVATISHITLIIVQIPQYNNDTSCNGILHSGHADDLVRNMNTSTTNNATNYHIHVHEYMYYTCTTCTIHVVHVHIHACTTCIHVHVLHVYMIVDFIVII